MAVSSVRFLAALLLVCLIAPLQPRAEQGAATLMHAHRSLATLPAAREGRALAAEVSAEGHWTFVNTAGERFTTASAEELKRMLPTLAPEAAKPGVRLTLLVTEDTVFRHRVHLQALPLATDRRTDLMIAVGAETYPLARRGERATERLYAEIRPNVLVELVERRLFDEATWQLAHPIRRSAIRILALEPGGPTSVPTAPRLDPQTKRAITDAIAPGSLATALRALSGQTVLLTVRRDGDALAFRPASGPEQTLPAREVLAAAVAADVNLVLMQASTPRQPGTRSWLWQRVSVGRLDNALVRDHLADFLNALASPQAKLLVGVDDIGAGRIRLLARPMKDESSPRTGIGETLSEFASSIVGEVVVSSVEASLRDRARQAELDRRVLPGIPSVVQWVYGALLALGLLGHGVARGWWARLWPAERRESYRGAFGFTAARMVRSLLYGTLYLPLVSLASAPMALASLLRRPAPPSHPAAASDTPAVAGPAS